MTTETLTEPLTSASGNDSTTQTITSDNNTTQVVMVEVSQEESVQSPTASVGSALSMDSTENLIKSLSMHRLDAADAAENGQAKKATQDSTEHSTRTEQSQYSQPKEERVHSGSLQTSSAESSTLLPVLPKAGEKKPVKFTVRKVSRDTISIPEKQKTREGREYLYGNIPENRALAQQRKASDKLSQLQYSQQKYDQYEARIEKINKEIAFLTNLLPPYNVEIDYATRSKITRAIEKLRMKQDEIGKKKYSLGITISRLWREHDENDIWVRSVSNQ